MATKKRTQQRRVDWSLRPRGTVSATAQAALGLTAVAALGDVASVSPVWGAVGTVAGMAGSVLVSAYTQAPPVTIWYRVGCWVGAGGWLTWTLLTTPWHPDTLTALAAGALTAGLCAPLARPRRRTGPAGQAGRPGTAVVVSTGGQVGRAWQERIARVCRIKVAVTDVTPWPTGTGYDVHVDLPIGGATKADLARCVDGLAADARLPIGCGVEPDDGPNRGTAVLRVSTVNRLNETITTPADYSLRSILQEVELGEYRDGQVTAVPLRELSGVVTGQKGSGKTNVLDVLTLGVGRCRDALVWHIDLNGGGMSQLWLDPWLEGDTDRPAIDWAAPTPKEALFMVRVALGIAKDRKSSYRKLKIQANSKLLPISPQLPEIVLIVDEGGEVLAPSARGVIAQIRDGLEEIQRIGRNEAVNVVVSSLRATADMIAPNVKKQSGARIGMFVQDDEELAFLFGWNKGISTADLPTPGCGFIQHGQQVPRPFKARFLDPAQITQAAVAIAGQRPELDEAGRAVGDQVYATRYERMREFFGGAAGDGEDELVLDGVPLPRPAAAGRPAPAGRPRLRVVSGGGPGSGSAADWPDPATMAVQDEPEPVLVGAAAWPDPATLAATTAPTAAPKPVPAYQAATTAGPHAIPASGPRPAVAPSSVPASAERPIPRLLTQIAGVFDAHPSEYRLHTGILCAALGENPQKLAALLRPCGITSGNDAFALEDTSISEAKLRGYLRADVDTAIERIRTGQIVPPRKVYAWPAT